MKKDALILEIEAYAAAHKSQNALLMQRQAAALNGLLESLPDDLPEKTKEHKPEPTS